MEEFLALLAAFALFTFFAFVVLYIYMGFAFMAIGKKAKLETPALSWIPFVGPMIIAYQASKMHWWPWLLYIGIILPFLNILASLALTVVFIVWLWKTYEAINKPGWWALLIPIPVVGLVFMGVAAWSKD